MCSKINAELITEVEYKIKLQRKMEKYENLEQKKVDQRVKVERVLCVFLLLNYKYRSSGLPMFKNVF